jgi:hypothetical protein
MIRCLHCGAETNNGLALCELCRRMASGCFEYLPIYFRNLARWRPGRAGSRPVPGSRVLYDGHVPDAGTGDRISDTLDETANVLTTRARMLVDDRPHLARLLDRLAAARSAETITEAEAIAWLCKGFERYLTSIATLDWCGDFVRDLGHHETNLRALTETFVPGWYAGGCRQLVGFDADGAAMRCDSGTYVVPGLTWVTCGACGATTYARDHLEVVLEEARGWVAPPKRIAETVVALVDTELSVPRLYTRIRQWAFVEQLAPVYRTARDYSWSIKEDRFVVTEQATGSARYRFGDVLDLVLRDTRALASAKTQRVS